MTNRVFVTKSGVINVDSNVECEKFLNSGATELSSNDIAALGMSGYEHLISPANTQVSTDGAIKFTPPTEEELAAQAVAEARVQSRSILMARMQADMVQTGAFAAAEFATFAKAGLFADWAAGQTYAKGYRLAHKGIVYEVMQEVTSLENQPPFAKGMLAIYRPISVDPDTGEEPDGSKEHPFIYLNGMDVHSGKYYSYNNHLYLAKSDMTACVWPPDTEGLWQWELVS